MVTLAAASSRSVPAFKPSGSARSNDSRVSDCHNKIRRRHNMNRKQSLNNETKLPSHGADARYKTELCNKFREQGTCPYGRLCRFAHGIHELRRSDRCQDPRYKTQKCNHFWNTGHCPYAKRCRFIHRETPQQLAQLRRYGYIEDVVDAGTSSPVMSSAENPSDPMALGDLEPIAVPAVPLRRTPSDAAMLREFLQTPQSNKVTPSACIPCPAKKCKARNARTTRLACFVELTSKARSS